MRKTHILRVRRYYACIIEPNEHLDEFYRGKASDKIGKTELNKILLNTIPNGWNKKAYIQGFDCEKLT